MWLPRDLAFAFVLIAALAVGGIVLGGGQRALWIVLVAALFPIISVVLQSGIERMCAPAGPRKNLRSWLLHLQINTFFQVLLSLLTVASYLGCAALARRFGFELGVFDLRFASSWVLLIPAVWLSSIISDFFFYWYHRWTHENAFLWQHHKMHHTDRELEAISTARQNWIEAVFNSVFITVPIILLFKVDPQDQWSTGILAGVTASFVVNVLTLSHMNVRWQAGWLSRVWCSPQVHRLHHSLEPQHINKNYAFMFPMWDVLFGTYCQPQRDEFPATGVDGESGFETFWEAETYSQREWVKYVRTRRTQSTPTSSLRP